MSEIIKRVNELMDAIPYRDEPERKKEIIRGKWRWIGHASHAVHLVTEKGGQQYLLSTMRKGFNGSQFQVRADGGGYGIMEPASKFYVSRASYDLENIVDIDNPVCQLIKLIPDMVQALNSQAEEIAKLKAEHKLPEPMKATGICTDDSLCFMRVGGECYSNSICKHKGVKTKDESTMDRR